MENEHIFDPLKQYKNVFKDLHHENTTKLFEELVTKSNINIEENKDTVKKIERFEKQRLNVKKQINKMSGFRVLFIILFIVLPLISGSFLTNLSIYENQLLYLIISISLLVLSVFLVYLVFFKMNPFIKNLKNDEGFLDKEIAKNKELAWGQMNNLNNLFTDKMSTKLFKQTIPLINMDHMFDSRRFDYLVNKFNLGETSDFNRSTLFVQSGDINGNPFYIANDLVHRLGTKRYTGTKVISWTTYSTVNGKRVATRRTQTLVATLDKPYPYYHEESYIVYGNEAAPNLTFTRTDSDAEIMTDKQIDKTVRKEEKRLEKKARKSVKKGDNYTLLGNTEFEVLFGAKNRNNEVEFRLLFTPLAQRQLLELMKDKTIGYGDNFALSKYKKINVIYPDHLKGIKLNVDADYFKGYDFDKVKKRFIDYNNEYFKSIYFGFAPFLAIPLYQQHKPHEYIYKDLYDSNVSFYEHEVVANKFNETEFKHPLGVTRSILKTSIVKSDSTKDVVKVTANSYKIEPRVEMVSKMGGDGKLHIIPVNWDEYIPVKQESTVEIDIIKEEKEENYQDKINNLIERLRNNEELSQKEVYLTSKFIGRIIK